MAATEGEKGWPVSHPETWGWPRATLEQADHLWGGSLPPRNLGVAFEPPLKVAPATFEPKGGCTDIPRFL
jgi:hypothetical protein